MSNKILHVLAGLACALALGVGTATAARDARLEVIVFTVHNLGDASAECGGFGLSFDMVAPGGSLLGGGVSCIQSFEGCEFAAGCHATVSATFTLTFEAGTLTAPVVLNEAWPRDSIAMQVDHGTISSGTGEFVGATGSIDCYGTVRFTATDVIPRLTCVVRLD
jgi:hypothetical protein